ncbi:hypothetical protein WA026_019620 [Henosepilachna vigintioctopunctata]|uniref:Uncharacterized protein n=1 Tax=Henosepilachna vigintioctopunctata TaxID=420089 RepID=A0AAW1TW49_9CUCU
MEEPSKCSSRVGKSTGSKRSNSALSQITRGVVVASKSNLGKSMTSDRVTRPVKHEISPGILANTNQIKRKSNMSPIMGDIYGKSTACEVFPNQHINTFFAELHLLRRRISEVLSWTFCQYWSVRN